jgi:hypothetical protein
VSDPDPLDDLAARVANNPYLLAFALALHQRRHDLGDLALAAELHRDPSALAGLRLCRRPAPGAGLSEEDVGAIARRFGCDARALRRILEEAGAQA